MCGHICVYTYIYTCMSIGAHMCAQIEEAAAQEASGGACLLLYYSRA